jgi:hypothetical protein
MVALRLQVVTRKVTVNPGITQPLSAKFVASRVTGAPLVTEEKGNRERMALLVLKGSLLMEKGVMEMAAVVLGTDHGAEGGKKMLSLITRTMGMVPLRKSVVVVVGLIIMRLIVGLTYLKVNLPKYSRILTLRLKLSTCQTPTASSR